MKRINFLLAAIFLFFAACNTKPKTNQTQNDYDICIYGGTSAGVIAAYSAKKMGKSVIIVAPKKHLGGLSASGLGHTDIGNKYAIIGISREFYRKLGKHYQTFEQWMFEPSAAEKIFNEYVKAEDIPVIFHHRIVNATTENSTIKQIEVENAEKPEKTTNKTITAKIFIDATYEGDLLARAGVSYTIGREANSQYNEKFNGVQRAHGNQIPDGIDPYIVPGDSSSGLLWGISNEKIKPNGTGDKKLQAYNYRICLTSDTTNMIPITKPENYDPATYEILRRIIKQRDEAQWVQHLHQLYLRVSKMPNNKTDMNNKGGFSTDYIGMNYDYPEADYETRKKIEKEHELYIKGLFYFLAYDQDVPQHLKDQMLQYGWPKDEFTDNGGFPFYMYIREARRMIGEYIMTEHNCTGDSIIEDWVAFGAYNMDSHNATRLIIDGQLKNEGDVQEPVDPYPISYRSIVPKKAECKNLIVPICVSASHIAYGSIRMEPVFMELGQVAGMAATIAIDGKKAVQDIDVNKIQNILTNDPYLNGTPPDILVDNEDADLTSFEGEWEMQKNKRMKYYKTSSLIHPANNKPAKAVFNIPVKTQGTYAVYYYCPYKVNEAAKKYSDYEKEAHIELQHKNGTENKTINLHETKGDWIAIGEFEFDKDQKYSFTLEEKECKNPLTIDAILLVYKQ